MLLVVADAEDIPGWLYPAAFPEIARPAENAVKSPALGEHDFAALWRAIEPIPGELEALQRQYAHCSTGVPHNAPDSVGRVHSALVAKLAELPDGERWRVAQAWAEGRLKRRPNHAEMTRHKDLVKALCGLARRAVAARQPVLLLPVG